MKNVLLLSIVFFGYLSNYAQEERRVPFSTAISAHIVKYNQKINVAYEEQDLERATFLFDSLVNFHLVGTYLDNFNVNPIKGDPIYFEEYEKPIFLITYATWCVPGAGEIPALNDLADRFHDQIDFIMLFWDNVEDLKDIEADYSENIHLVYIDERANQNGAIINKLKHSLGFPMMYFMNSEKKMLDIRKIVTHHSSETLSNSYNIHFDSLSKGVSLLMADLDKNSENLSTEKSNEDNDIYEDEDYTTPEDDNYEENEDEDGNK
ncbi:TlpA family protein disulfide reductase [Aquimarina sp. W85]|uniref:TlpA family protein disulfide reductase n=1 Tax=Aquimarina rhodophyticola TaxID=3342246 RepID=UPI0036704E58